MARNVDYSSRKAGLKPGAYKNHGEMNSPLQRWQWLSEERGVFGGGSLRGSSLAALVLMRRCE
jgi:hypothetical protein